MAKRKKSKLYVGYTNIESMTIQDLQGYIKKATPYVRRKVQGLAKSKYAGFSKSIQFLQSESDNYNLYGISAKQMSEISTYDTAKLTAKRDAVDIYDLLTDTTGKSPSQLKKTAHMLNYISGQFEQPSALARKYVVTGEEMANILKEMGYDDAAKEIDELSKSARGVTAMRDWWKIHQSEIWSMVGSGDDEDDINIRYYADTYGEDSSEFFRHLFKRINELKNEIW